MEIPAIVDFADDGSYRARCRHPVEAEGTGPTRYVARLALEAALKGRVPEPFELLALEETPDKPWISSAGSVPDDEITEAWLDAIAEYRRDRDADDQANAPQARTSPTAQPVP